MMRPAGGQEVAMTHERLGLTKPTPQELLRRQAVAKQILAAREKNVIRPLTTADLVQQARQESAGISLPIAQPPEQP